jgi:hypothetical protein
MIGKQPSKAFPPNKALQVFKPLIGVWDTVGTHGMIPDTTLHGRTTFEWHESGGFIRTTSNIQEDVGIPTGVAIIGSDDELGTYVMSYYDERGVSRTYNVSLQDNVMKWWRDAPSFSQRYSLTISDDQQTMVGKGELSKDGSTWQKDLDLTYTKVEP